MKSHLKLYICRNCGYNSSQWLGRCPNCGEWNSLKEKIEKGWFTREERKIEVLAEVEIQPTIRIKTGIKEFDYTIGGVVKGGITLLGGAPGVGKSTLILQVVEKLAQKGEKVLYVSGEEMPSQVKMRAKRFGIKGENIHITMHAEIEKIEKEIIELSPHIIVVDSIQAVYSTKVEGIPGSPSQVRECGFYFMKTAKLRGMSIFLIAHVTKEGIIAGPKMLEHMVDTVLYLEGGRDYFYRILRVTKNRFGTTDEIGIFEMKEKGLVSVEDPSLIFLSKTKHKIPGNIVTCTIEGTRPLLVEIQALISPPMGRVPQRIVSGVDYNRVNMLLAVIERRIGLKIGLLDVFINVVGGFQIRERATDLAVILAIISVYKKKNIPPNTIAIGEVGLGGEVRQVNLIERRLLEGERHNFKKCIAPVDEYKGKIKVIKVKDIKEAVYGAFNYNS
jgi:DNA repair protein RadA/Sms